MPQTQKQPGAWDVVSTAPASADGWNVVATGADQPPDNRNVIQQGFDSFVTPKGGNDPVTNSLERFGAGALEGAGSLFVHPIKSAQSMMLNAPNVIDPTGLLAHTLHTPTPLDALKGAVQQPERTAGNLVGGATLGEMGGAVGRGVESLGDTLSQKGNSLLNDTMGVTRKMMQHGQNPARGVDAEGLFPSLSKSSLERKIGAILPERGQAVSDAVDRYLAPAPSEPIASAIDNPIDAAKAVFQGPGGGTRSVAPLEDLRNSFNFRAPGASRPIYGPNGGTPFAPNETVGELFRASRTGPKLLNAPPQEVPLHSSPDVAGTPSRVVKLFQPDRPATLGLPAPSLDTPMTSLENFPDQLAGSSSSVRDSPFSPSNGMGAGEYFGQIPGERGGPGTPQGTLRQPQIFPPSSEPSPFLNMNHPFSSPVDLWKTIRNVDENTRFNPDPEIEGVNEVRRDIRGGLRNVLEDVAPNVKPTSQRYGDLRVADDALSRSTSPTVPKTLKEALTFPIWTTVGSAMTRAGKLATGIAPAVPTNPFVYTAPLVAGGTKNGNR